MYVDSAILAKLVVREPDSAFYVRLPAGASRLLLCGPWMRFTWQPAACRARCLSSPTTTSCVSPPGISGSRCPLSRHGIGEALRQCRE